MHNTQNLHGLYQEISSPNPGEIYGPFLDFSWLENKGNPEELDLRIFFFAPKSKELKDGISNRSIKSCNISLSKPHERNSQAKKASLLIMYSFTDKKNHAPNQEYEFKSIDVLKGTKSRYNTSDFGQNNIIIDLLDYDEYVKHMKHHHDHDIEAMPDIDLEKIRGFYNHVRGHKRVVVSGGGGG